ncbi:hypothetical protein E2C01_072304 [Portunus trituberculatus]|uniref:Uncharacterized protein n=1 Tax=Portunus trituberculatus TaxID=210409 RepID=A0A5B7I7D2_PORTR|nr:hypothetical protein [Portunus trituberculatus]
MAAQKQRDGGDNSGGERNSAAEAGKEGPLAKTDEREDYTENIKSSHQQDPPSHLLLWPPPALPCPSSSSSSSFLSSSSLWHTHTSNLRGAFSGS